MITKKFHIDNIPAILWGEKVDKVYIYVHGKMSDKESAYDLAEKAVIKGYQVLSFDLPEHGERIDKSYSCNIWNAVNDIKTVGNYVSKNWNNVSLCACSLGAYFSLLAFENYKLQNSIFLSPILDMKRLIENMMSCDDITPKMLKEQQEIQTKSGDMLFWDYYSYAVTNKIKKWDVKTFILYGSDDNFTERAVVDNFVEKFKCDLTVMQGSEHWFHTEVQLKFLSEWLNMLFN